MCIHVSAGRRGCCCGCLCEAHLGVGGGRCGLVFRGYPLIGRLVSCGCRHALGVDLPFFPLPVLVFLCFFELASSSG